MYTYWYGSLGYLLIKLGLQFLQNVHAFTYKELKVATNDFHPSNKIGEGGFGSVYKGRLNDGVDVAVKVLSAESKQGDREFMSELASLSNICHQNLVKMRGGCIEGRRRILVYDYMEHNSLAHMLQGKNTLSYIVFTLYMTTEKSSLIRQSDMLCCQTINLRLIIVELYLNVWSKLIIW